MASPVPGGLRRRRRTAGNHRHRPENFRPPGSSTRRGAFPACNAWWSARPAATAAATWCGWWRFRHAARARRLVRRHAATPLAAARGPPVQEHGARRVAGRRAELTNVDCPWDLERYGGAAVRLTCYRPARCIAARGLLSGAHSSWASHWSRSISAAAGGRRRARQQPAHFIWGAFSFAQQRPAGHLPVITTCGRSSWCGSPAWGVYAYVWRVALCRRARP